MQLLKAPLSLLALLAAGLELVQGQYMINDLSFGYSGKCVALPSVSITPQN